MAQNNPWEENEPLQRRIEVVAEEASQESPASYGSLLRTLEDLSRHPLDLNRATREELENTGLLDPFQVINLLEYIRETGPLLSIYELQAIKGFDPATIRTLLPFVTLHPVERSRGTPLDLIRKARNDLFLRYERELEPRKGYTLEKDTSRQGYLGDPNRYYVRFRRTTDNGSSVGLTADKDPGEEFLQGSQPYGFDHYSAHLFLRELGPVKALAIGDYELGFGQGNAVWSGLAFGSSGDPLGIKRHARGIAPYTSAGEERYFRGLAATGAIGEHWELTGFYSRRKVDAALAPGKDPPLITSMPGSGYHRRPSELKKKNVLLTQHEGGHLTYRTNRMNLGATAITTRYKGRLNRGKEPEDRFAPQGSRFSTSGVDGNILLGKFDLFGEFSMDRSLHTSHTLGCSARLHERLSWVVSKRYFEKGYHAPVSNPFGKKGTGEKGYYMGFQVHPFPHIRLEGGMDRYHYEWLTYQANAPASGHALQGNLVYTPSEKASLSIRYRQKKTPGNFSGSEAKIRPVLPTIQNSGRLYFKAQLSRRIGIANRLAFTFAREKEQKEQGILLYQDLYYDPKSFPLSVRFRYALFNTDSYTSRIYAYEHDVLYSFSVPAYYETGSRTYLMLRYRFSRYLHAWLKIAQWYYSDKETIGSGLNETDGSTRSSVSLQARIKF